MIMTLELVIRQLGFDSRGIHKPNKLFTLREDTLVTVLLWERQSDGEEISTTVTKLGSRNMPYS